MWVDAHWSARGLAALKATLGDVDSHTRKAMVQFLLDEAFWDADKLTWDGAIARWNDCLNPGKPAFFKLAELWALMRRFERHDVFHAMAADLGYETRRVPTEERRLAAIERMAAAVDTCEAALAAARTELAHLHHGDPPNASARGQGGRPVRFAIDDGDEQTTTGPGSF